MVIEVHQACHLSAQLIFSSWLSAAGLTFDTRTKMAHIRSDIVVWIALLAWNLAHTEGLGNDGIVVTIQPGSPMIRFIPGFPSDFRTNATLYRRDASFGIGVTNAKFQDCASDFNRTTLYLFDTYSATIYSYSGFAPSSNFTNLELNTFHRGTSRGSVKMAVDWISNNVYWTDPYFRWIVVQAGYPNTDPTRYRVLVQDNLQRPYAIAVDPREGYLFWSDVGTVSKLERASLDGTERKTLSFTGIILPYGMTLDLQDRMIYWVDAARDTIEVMTYDGSNRRVVVRYSHTTFYGIAVFQNTLAVTELRRTPSVYFLNKVTGRQIAYSYNQTGENYYGVTIFHQSAQPVGTDSCATLTCSHMCVRTRGGATCICKEGFEMDSNGACQETAAELYRAFIFSDSQSFCGFDVKALEHPSIFPLQCFYNVTSGTITAFDVDMVERQIIFAKDRAIYTLNLPPASQTPTLLLTTSEAISSLALDWRNKNIYWTSDTSVKVASQNSRTERTLQSGLTQPRDLIIIPHRGKLLWITGNLAVGVTIMAGDIQSLGMSTVVYSGNLNQPTSLTYDPQEQKLYWTDQGYIMTAEVNGSSVKRIPIFGPAVPNQIQIYKGKVVWTVDGTSNSYIYSTNTEDFSPVGYITLSSYGLVSFMRVLDAFLQPNERGPCDVENGQCAQICLPDGQNRTCECEFGYTKGADNQSCTTHWVEDNFALLTDWTHNRIYQIELGSGQVNGVPAEVAYSPTGVTYDRRTSRIIFGSNGIRSVFLNGTGQVLLTDTAALGGAPDRFAIDETSGNIFYTAVRSSAPLSWVGVVTAAGDHRILIRTGAYPRAIKLDPKEGYLFWTDHGATPPFVARANMDGTGMVKIVTTDLIWPNGLAIDYTAKTLYLTDGYNDVIKKCTYGGICSEFLSDVGAHLMDVDMDETYLYYTSWTNPYITRVNKLRPEQVTRIANNAVLGRLDSIVIYKSSLLQPANQACSGRSGLGDCSTICLPTHTGRACSCPDGVTLQPDGRTCQGATRCPLNVVTNGNLQAGCYGLVYETCQYACATGFNKTADQLSCLSTGTWDRDTTRLCLEIVTCPPGIVNGRLATDCRRQESDTCQFSCDAGYKKDPSLSSLTCLSTGAWNHDTGSVCLEIVTCPSTVLNGRLATDCRRQESDTCQYSCDAGYMKDLSVSELTCLSTGAWNHDTTRICSEIVICPPGVLNGRLTTDCRRQKSDTCQYSCDAGYMKDLSVSELTCLSTGAWNHDTSRICSEEIVICPPGVLNGRLATDCRRQESDTCQYSCDAGYKTTVSDVTCLSSGAWNHDTDRLCSEIVTCPSTVLNGRLATDCRRQEFDICQYSCDDGYEKGPFASQLTCRSTGAWNYDTSDVCKEAFKEQPAPQTAMYAGIGGGVGGLVLIGVIAVVAVIYLKRKKGEDGRAIYVARGQAPGQSENDFENPNYASFEKRISAVSGRDSTYATIGPYETLTPAEGNAYVTLNETNRHSAPYELAPPVPSERGCYLNVVDQENASKSET